MPPTPMPAMFSLSLGGVRPGPPDRCPGTIVAETAVPAEKAARFNSSRRPRGRLMIVSHPAGEWLIQDLPGKSARQRRFLRVYQTRKATARFFLGRRGATILDGKRLGCGDYPPLGCRPFRRAVPLISASLARRNDFCPLRFCSGPRKPDSLVLMLRFLGLAKPAMLIRTCLVGFLSSDPHVAPVKRHAAESSISVVAVSGCAGILSCQKRNIKTR